MAVLTIMHQVGLHRGQDGEIDRAAFKIVYIAPMKRGGAAWLDRIGCGGMGWDGMGWERRWGGAKGLARCSRAGLRSGVGSVCL